MLSHSNYFAYLGITEHAKWCRAPSAVHEEPVVSASSWSSGSAKPSISEAELIDRTLQGKSTGKLAKVKWSQHQNFEEKDPEAILLSEADV